MAELTAPLATAHVSPEDESVRLDVVHLSYKPNLQGGEALRDISFKVLPGQICAILSPEFRERKSLLYLIANRRRYGEYSGDILISGMNRGTYFNENTGFMTEFPTYVKGLSYKETLYYAAKLRLGHTMKHQQIVARVVELLNLFDLMWCKDTIIEDLTNRGAIGGQLRRLGVAMEVVHLPKLIFLSEPFSGLDVIMATELMSHLKELCRRDHTILCTMDKPPSAVFQSVSSCVVLSGPRMIFAGPVSSIVPHFTSSALNYRHLDDQSPSDFVLDIAAGLERPRNSRVPLSAQELSDAFLESDLYQPPLRPGGSIQISAIKGGKLDDKQLSWWVMLQTLLQRAIIIKRRQIKEDFRLFFRSLMLGGIIGVILFDNVRVDKYLTNLMGLPYEATSNCFSAVFFVSALSCVLPILRVETFSEKNIAFRDEQFRGISNPLLHLVVMLITELPFILLGEVICMTTLYALVNFGWDLEKYMDFLSISLAAVFVATMLVLTITAFCKTEKSSRDVFLVALMFEVLLCGFLFQIPSMSDFWSKMSQIDPLRWALEGLMIVAFKEHPDGNFYLSGFGFDGVSHKRALHVLISTGFVMLVVYFLTLLRLPNRLRYKHSIKRQSVGSTVSGEDSEFSKAVTLNQPLMFSRTPSTMSEADLNSLMGGDERLANAGYAISFDNLTHVVSKLSEPLGFQMVLDDVSGRFLPGQFNVIMGVSGAGKSSLLRILAGYPTAGRYQGMIAFNGEQPPSQFWRRCAFVADYKPLIQSLTVRQVLKYSLQLRSTREMTNIDLNFSVNQVLDLFSLRAMSKKVVSSLSPSTQRRLTLAEACVTMPSTVLIDEPFSDCDTTDTVLIMNGLRELVNQHRTVVCTVHQPSEGCFHLFDQLLVLSAGRVVYHGPASEAVEFFTSSPFAFDPSGLNNPADFIVNAAACYLPTSTGETTTPKKLEQYYKLTHYYKSLDESLPRMHRFKSKIYNPLTRVYPQTTFNQIKILWTRQWQHTFAQKRLLLTTTALNFVLALILGWLWWDSGDDLFCVLGLQVFGVFMSVGLNLQFTGYLYRDVTLYLTETKQDLYSPAVYWLVSLTPIVFIRMCHVAMTHSIAYFMGNMQENRFSYSLLMFELTTVAALVLLQLCLVIYPRIRTAYMLFPGLLFFCTAFGGLMIRISTINDVFIWAPYVSFMRWAFQGLIINVTKNTDLLVDDPASQDKAYEGFVESLSYDKESAYDALMIEAGFLAGFWLLTFIAVQVNVWRKPEVLDRI